jgi:hypothetical protein
MSTFYSGEVEWKVEKREIIFPSWCWSALAEEERDDAPEDLGKLVGILASVA